MAKPTKPATPAQEPAQSTVHAPSAPHPASIGTNVATVEPAPAPAVAAAPKGIAGFVSKRRVILPTLVLQVGEPRLLVFATPMVVSTYVDPDPKKRTEKPATIAEVGDPTTGESFLLLVPAVLEENIRKAYSGEDYLGRVFFVEKLPKRPSKRYHDIRLEEGEYNPPALEGPGE
jgi:hypothetical protein